MKSYSSFALLSVIVLCFVADACAQSPDGTKMFLLQDPARQVWCGFKEETLWKAEVEATGAQVVATVEYDNGKPSEIDLTEAAESGDWIAYDRYSVSSSGMIFHLERTINLSSSDRSIEESYSLEDGKAVLQTRFGLEQGTGNRASLRPDEEVPEIPVVGDLRKFGFASLLERPENWTQPSYCVNEIR